jgi:hypothetical protein
MAGSTGPRGVPDFASELVVFLVGWSPLTLDFHLAKTLNEIADATRLHALRRSKNITPGKRP